jgi:hypothetical protein
VKIAPPRRGPQRRDDPIATAWWAGLLVLTAGFFLIDVFVLGMPLFGMLACSLLGFTMLVLGLFRWYRGDRRQARRSLLRVLLFTLCGAGAYYTCAAAHRATDEDARAIAAALDAYRDETGKLPASLNELVPAHLAELPAPGIRWAQESFHYKLDSDGYPHLSWPMHVMGGKAHFDFENTRVEVHRR